MPSSLSLITKGTLPLLNNTLTEPLRKMTGLYDTFCSLLELCFRYAIIQYFGGPLRIRLRT